MLSAETRRRGAMGRARAGERQVVLRLALLLILCLGGVAGGGRAARPVAAAPTYTEYGTGIPGNPNYEQIAVGPDGALWFTALPATAIWRIGTDGVFSSYPLPQSAG